MAATVTASAAVVSGAGLSRTLLVTLGGFLLAIGGFSLDFHADRHLDAAGPRARNRRNPLAGGELPPAAGLVFSLSFLGAGLVVCGLVSAWWLALRPSASLARVLTMVFMMGEGTLICLAAILPCATT